LIVAVVGSGELEVPQVGGSIRKFTLRPVRGLCHLGHEVHFFDSTHFDQSKLGINYPNFYIHKVPHPNFQLLKSSNTTISAFQGHLNMIAFSISLFFKLWKLIKRIKFDVINVNTRYDVIAIIFLQKLLNLNIPLVFTCHNSDWSRGRLPLVLRIFFLPEVFAIKKSTVTVAVSRKQREGIIKNVLVEPEKIKVLYQGVDKNLFKPGAVPKLNDPYILCVSDISARKNQLVLVEAMPKVLKYFPTCKLIFIGGIRDKAYLSKINHVARKLGISKNIEIKGKAPFKVLLYWIHKATICTLPTKREGFPTILLEMLACKKAVIASRIPEVLELKDLAGEEIFVTASPNNPDEWADKIIELLKDDERRQEYEKKADKIVVDEVEEARRYVRVYEEAKRATNERLG